MKKNNSKFFAVLFFLGIVLSLGSCDGNPIDEFFGNQFPESENMSNEMFIDGELAVPILNTAFTLEDFIPSLDSTLWIEVDDEGLVHLRMYFKNIFSVQASSIYSTPILPLVTIPEDSISFSTDTNKLKVYENALSGHLFFNNPKFTFIITNEIPIVAYFRIDTLRLHSTAHDSVYVRADKKYVINVPTTQFGSAQTEVVVDKNEIPGFEEFFSPIPEFASFFVTVGNEETQSTYAITGQEEISADVDIDLPIDVHLVDLVFDKTVNFSLDTGMNVEQIEKVTIKLIFDNEFPFEGLAQVSFADTNNNGGIDDIIMTLFEDDGWLFESAITNPNGETTSSTRSQITLELTQQQIADLIKYHASKLIVRAELNSYQTPDQDVKVFGWYKLGVKLGMKVTYAGNTDDL